MITAVGNASEIKDKAGSGLVKWTMYDKTWLSCQRKLAAVAAGCDLWSGDGKLSKAIGGKAIKANKLWKTAKLTLRSRISWDKFLRDCGRCTMLRLRLRTKNIWMEDVMQATSIQSARLLSVLKDRTWNLRGAQLEEAQINGLLLFPEALVWRERLHSLLWTVLKDGMGNSSILSYNRLC